MIKINLTHSLLFINYYGFQMWIMENLKWHLCLTVFIYHLVLP